MAKRKKNSIEEEVSQISQEIIEQMPIGKMVMDAFLDFGNYINNQRHTASIYDGCKPSYRRLIFAGLQFPKGKIVPSTNFISSVSNYHPHSLSGIEGLNANLVHSGVFTGEGSWGYTEINGTYNQYAAPRYTKERVSDLYLDILGDLWKEVPMIESPVGPMEVSFLPLPLPLCLRGDTKVYLTDGRNLTIREIVEEFKQGKENYVLSCNLDGDFSIAKVIDGCKTKTSKKYIRITLDNGEVVNSTEDHRFLMRDGEYKKAEELKEGDSMMPGYFTTSDFGRLAIKNNFSLNSPCIYKLASLYNIHHGVYPFDPDKKISHHIDKNPNNNNPNNIINLSNKEHSILHISDRVNAITPEVREKARNKDPEFKKKSNRGHIVSRFKKLINIDKLTYEDALKEITSRDNFKKWFKDVDDFIELEKTWNHTVVKVEVIDDTEDQDFYDITVDSKNHNFLLSCGIIAHNCLYLKGSVQGLGVAIKSDYPNFSPISMYNAYINNNPQLLEPNANLFIDKSNSELDKLWKTGKGRVIYSYKISRTTDSMGNPAILFEGDTFLFTPNFKKFKKLIEEGKVYIDDLTDINGPKLIVSKIPGARGITIEEIEDLCRECCYKASTYNTNVTTGSTTYRIGLYDWIDFTYKNYIGLLVEVNKKKIRKTEFDIKVLESIPIIADYILNNNPRATDEEICKGTGISMDVVSSVMSKPISYIRKNKDTSSRVKELKDKLKELKKFDPVKYTEEIIKKL